MEAVNQRVIAYVDGYNVYYGFLRKGWRKYLWLDYRSLFERILKDDQELVVVKYFTAPSRRTDSFSRQQRYHSALDIRGGLKIIPGRLVRRNHKCQECGHKSHREQEKETDARITIEMLIDAEDGEVDELWLMSRDADLVPVVEKIRERYQLKVLIVLPPNGSDDRAGGDALVAAAGGHRFNIRPQIWKQSQLPNPMQRAKGSRRVWKPEEWNDDSN